MPFILYLNFLNYCFGFGRLPEIFHIICIQRLIIALNQDFYGISDFLDQSSGRNFEYIFKYAKQYFCTDLPVNDNQVNENDMRSDRKFPRSKLEYLQME